MKSRQYIIFLSVLIVLFSCSDEEAVIVDNSDSETSSLYFPPIDSDTWETKTTTELGWNTAAESDLLDFLDQKGTKAFIVLKDGKIAIENYFNGATINDKNPWNSAAKTLTAFTIGIAQEEGLLSTNNTSSDYLGKGWSGLTTDQENNITVWNHLTMTTGLDYTVDDIHCTDRECLIYKNEPGSAWFYHNAPYTLLTKVITGATSNDFRLYFNEKIKNKIGMDGSWINIGYNEVFLSTARSMARFGLLNLNKGTWNTTPVLQDQDYFNQMTSSSQKMNASYGYLWWLNGQENFMAPGSELQFNENLIPNAPDDLIAGLGKNDQKLYIVPSQNLVVVRMGDDGGDTLVGPSSFDNLLWEKLNALIK